MSEQVERINKVLDKTYGRNLSDKPIFRIVWSNDQLEKRFGVYNEYYGKIFLREIRGLQEVPKYPYLSRVWILERWMPPELAYTPEIPATSQGSYEPVFAFQDGEYKAIPIVEQEIHRLIYQLFHPELPGHRASELKAGEQKEFDAEVKQTEEELAEQGRTWIGHRLHSKEGIIVP